MTGAPDRPWKSRWLAFDTEFTGGSAHARLVSVATVLFVDGTPTGSYLKHFNPGPLVWKRRETYFAMKVNGLKREFLEQQPTIDSCWPEVLQEFSKSDLWVGHNPASDLRVLRRERAEWDARSGESSDRLVTRASVVDTILLDSSLRQAASSRKLGAACAAWGVSLDRAHEADADAEACGLLLARMAPKLQDRRSELIRLGTKPRSMWRGRQA